MKRIDELKELSREHHAALLMARHCIKLNEANDQHIKKLWSGVLAFFNTDLEPHFRIEESCIAPVLKKTGENQLCNRLLSEHATLREIIGNKNPVLADINSFGTILKNHIKFEENELFDHIQRSFSPQQLLLIQQASEKQKNPE